MNKNYVNSWIVCETNVKMNLFEKIAHEINVEKNLVGGKSFMEKNYKQINESWKITQKLKAAMINELC